MENPNPNEVHLETNNQIIPEEAPNSNPEVDNNIKEEKIILNDNDVQQINNNIDDNNINDKEMALNKMDIESNKEKNQEEQNSINENINDESKKEKTAFIRYPLAKIKNIMKLDNDIKLCQKDAYTVIGKMTEMFLQELARGAYAVCKSCRRKTINLEDINSAIKMDPKMGFINFNSIFYVQELNKVKKRATSTKKVEKKMEKEKIEGEDNINENNANNKEKKKRGKTTKTKNINPIRNKTLDSMFGNKDNK
jgi:DNA polymerase epsilon subunit 4